MYMLIDAGEQEPLRTTLNSFTFSC